MDDLATNRPEFSKSADRESYELFQRAGQLSARVRAELEELRRAHERALRDLQDRQRERRISDMAQARTDILAEQPQQSHQPGWSARTRLTGPALERAAARRVEAGNKSEQARLAETQQREISDLLAREGLAHDPRLRAERQAMEQETARRQDGWKERRAALNVQGHRQKRGHGF